jgi:hypothetical protein
MVQEGPSGNIDFNLFAKAINAHLVDRLNWACGLTMDRTKSGKIMSSDKDLRGIMHRCGI